MSHLNCSVCKGCSSSSVPCNAPYNSGACSGIISCVKDNAETQNAIRKVFLPWVGIQIINGVIGLNVCQIPNSINPAGVGAKFLACDDGQTKAYTLPQLGVPQAVNAITSFVANVPLVVTHNLGLLYPIFQVWNTTIGQPVQVSTVSSTINTITLVSTVSFPANIRLI